MVRFGGGSKTVGKGHYVGKFDIPPASSLFTWFAGFTTFSVTESISQIKTQRKLIIRSMYINVSTNNFDTDCPVTVNVNGVPTLCTLNITSLTTGDFEVTDLAVEVGAGDKLSLNLDGTGITGTPLTGQWSIEYDYA